MFAELAFIDWVALVIAAVLLAGAASSLIIVTVAARQRRRPVSATPYEPRELGPGPRPIVSRATSPGATVIDLGESRRNASSGVTRAARADRLRRRPQPDLPPPVPAHARGRTYNATSASGALGLEYRAPVVTLDRHRARTKAVASKIGFAPRKPGFFEDPVGHHELRYWDGERWTEHVKEAGARFTDPL